MSLAEQTARVAGGGKNTLKAILQKLGVAVGDVPIDQYADLAGQISEKLLPDNLATAETAQLFDLDDNAPVREILEKIKDLFNTANSDISELNSAKARIVTGYYTGTGKAGADYPNSLSFESAIKLIGITKYWSEVSVHDEAMWGLTVFQGDSLPKTFVSGAGFGRRLEDYSSSSPSGKISEDLKTYSWYVYFDLREHDMETAARYQWNESGKPYYYFAIL